MNWVIHNWAALVGVAVFILENILPHLPVKANSTVQLVLGVAKLLLPKTGGAYVGVDLHKGFGAIAGRQNEGAPALHITDLSPKQAEKALGGKAFDWHTIPAAWLHNLELKGFHAATWDEVKQYLRGL